MTLPTIPESVYDHAMDTYLASPSGIHGGFHETLDAVWPDLYALAVASLPAPEPPWQPIEPGTVIKAGTRYRRICAAERVAAKDFAAGEGYSVDSRTVLDPDAALVEAIGSILTHYEGGKWGPESVAILAAIRETHTIEPKPTTGPLGGAR